MAVLFFSEIPSLHTKKMFRNTIRKMWSLQVPVSHQKSTGKRVHPCASFSASLTIEAALVLPLALFFFLALTAPMTWLDRQRMVQTCMEQAGAEIASYGIFADNSERSGEIPDILTDGAAAVWLGSKVSSFAKQAYVKKSEVYKDNGEIVFVVEYPEEVCFFSAILGQQVKYAAVKRRGWIGIRGKLEGDGLKSGGENDFGTETVYVGKGMGRYHLYRDCHYLSNDYQTVEKSDAEQGRIDGEKKTACGTCAKTDHGSDTVYITASGRHYHYDKNCASMVAYVEEIPKEEAEHLGLCSYCAVKKEKEEEAK